MKIMIRLMIVCFCLGMLTAAPAADAGDQALLTWSNPSARGDGSAFNPVTDQAGVAIYYGTTDPPTSRMTQTFSASWPAVQTGQQFTITNLAYATTYYFNVAAIDKYGKEGPKMASSVSKTTATPSAPGGCSSLTVQ